MQIPTVFSVYKVLLASLAASILTGCSANFVPSEVEPEDTPIGHIQGAVHGGNLPVTGAHIYLYAASTSGYGTNATSLICKPTGTCGTGSNTYEDGSGNYYVMTDANGNFALSGDYTCTAGQQVYIVAVGGNPGLTGTVNNTAIVQMAGLGQCPSVGNLAAQVPYIVINEVTTVAFAYAMGGFATTAYNVSTDATGTTAIANAMANAGNIVYLQYGAAPTAAIGNSNSVSPQAKIYALANILSTCVNTTSSTSSQCTNLFKYATTSTGTVATDEANAIFNIVHNQAQNVGSIWNLSPSTPVFTPTLTAQPTDWTMPVIYKGVVSTPSTGGTAITSGPYNLVFDASGNAWIGDRANGVVEIGPQGAVTTFSPTKYGFGMVKGVAVSPEDGSIWVSDYNNNDVYVMNSSGTNLTTLTKDLTANGPILTAFALNPAGSGYLAYEANEEVPGIVLYDAGSYAMDKYEVGSTGFANIATPGWISVDQTGAVWVPSTDTAYIGGLTVKYKNDKMTYTASEPGVAASYTTTADGNGNVWVATNSGTATLYEVTAGNLSASVTGGGMNDPYKAVVDGNNTVWIANDGANTVSGWSTTSGAWLGNAGFSTNAASGTGCVVIGVDPSGNVWTGNSDQSVTQLLGLGTPTAAPFYGGSTVVTGTGKTAVTTVNNGNLGSKP